MYKRLQIIFKQIDPDQVTYNGTFGHKVELFKIVYLGVMCQQDNFLMEI